MDSTQGGTALDDLVHLLKQMRLHQGTKGALIAVACLTAAFGLAVVATFGELPGTYQLSCSLGTRFCLISDDSTLCVRVNLRGGPGNFFRQDLVVVPSADAMEEFELLIKLKNAKVNHPRSLPRILTQEATRALLVEAPSLPASLPVCTYVAVVDAGQFPHQNSTSPDAEEEMRFLKRVMGNRLPRLPPVFLTSDAPLPLSASVSPSYAATTTTASIATTIPGSWPAPPFVVAPRPPPSPDAKLVLPPQLLSLLPLAQDRLVAHVAPAEPVPAAPPDKTARPQRVSRPTLKQRDNNARNAEQAAVQVARENEAARTRRQRAFLDALKCEGDVRPAKMAPESVHTPFFNDAIRSANEKLDARLKLRYCENCRRTWYFNERNGICDDCQRSDFIKKRSKRMSLATRFEDAQPKRYKDGKINETEEHALLFCDENLAFPESMRLCSMADAAVPQGKLGTLTMRELLETMTLGELFLIQRASILMVIHRAAHRQASSSGNVIAIPKSLEALTRTINEVPRREAPMVFIEYERANGKVPIRYEVCRERVRRIVTFLFEHNACYREGLHINGDVIEAMPDRGDVNPFATLRVPDPSAISDDEASEAASEILSQTTEMRSRQTPDSGPHTFPACANPPSTTNSRWPSYTDEVRKRACESDETRRVGPSLVVGDQLKMLESLRPATWVDCFVLNHVRKSIMQARLPNYDIHVADAAFFEPMDPDFRRRRALDLRTLASMFSTSVSLFYVNLPTNIHWGLAVVRLDKREIILLDSAPGCNADPATNVFDFLLSWYEQCSAINPEAYPFSRVGWTFHQPQCPLQQDSFNCGVYVALFSILIARQYDAQSHLPIAERLADFGFLEKITPHDIAVMRLLLRAETLDSHSVFDVSRYFTLPGDPPPLPVPNEATFYGLLDDQQRRQQLAFDEIAAGRLVERAEMRQAPGDVTVLDDASSDQDEKRVDLPPSPAIAPCTKHSDDERAATLESGTPHPSSSTIRDDAAPASRADPMIWPSPATPESHYSYDNSTPPRSTTGTPDADALACVSSPFTTPTRATGPGEKRANDHSLHSGGTPLRKLAKTAVSSPLNVPDNIPTPGLMPFSSDVGFSSPPPATGTGGKRANDLSIQSGGTPLRKSARTVPGGAPIPAPVPFSSDDAVRSSSTPPASPLTQSVKQAADGSLLDSHDRYASANQAYSSPSRKLHFASLLPLSPQGHAADDACGEAGNTSSEAPEVSEEVRMRTQNQVVFVEGLQGEDFDTNAMTIAEENEAFQAKLLKAQRRHRGCDDDDDDDDGALPATSSVPRETTGNDTIRVPLPGLSQNPYSSNDPRLLMLAFPHLFLCSKGIPLHMDSAMLPPDALKYVPGRKFPTSFASQVAHLLKLSFVGNDGRLRFPFQDPMFVFWARATLQNFQVTRNTKHFYTEEGQGMTLENIRELAKTSAGRARMEGLVYRALQNMQGSAGYWATRRSELFEAVQQKGRPSVFFTVSFADAHNPALLRLLGMPYDAPVAERIKGVNEAAGVADEFFYQFAKIAVGAFFTNILKAEWWWFRLEYQLRGSPHLHGVAAVPELNCEAEGVKVIVGKLAEMIISNQPLPKGVKPEMRDALDDAVEAGTLELLVREGIEAHSIICDRIDAIVSGQNPNINVDTTELERLRGELDALDGSGVQRDRLKREIADEAKRIADEVRSQNASVKENFKQQAGDLDTLTHALTEPGLSTMEMVKMIISRTLIHECNKTYCYRMRKDGKGRDTECRFSFPQPLEAQTRLELTFPSRDDGEIELRAIHARNDPQLTPFCTPLLQLCGANVDLKVVCDYNTVLAYILKYATKGETGSQSVVAMLFAAIGDNKLGETASKSTSTIFERFVAGEYSSACSFLAAAAKAMYKARVVSLSEAVRVLLGGPLFHSTLSFSAVPSALVTAEVDVDDIVDNADIQQTSPWIEYGERALRYDESQQCGLRKGRSKAEITAMNAETFFRLFTVKPKAPIANRFALRASNNVVTYTSYLAAQARPPESSDHYSVWARFFLQRYRPWTGRSPGWSCLYDMLGYGLTLADMGLAGNLSEGFDPRTRKVGKFNLDGKLVGDARAVQSTFWHKAIDCFLGEEPELRVLYEKCTVSAAQSRQANMLGAGGGIAEGQSGGEGLREETLVPGEPLPSDAGQPADDECTHSIDSRLLAFATDEGATALAGPLLDELRVSNPDEFQKIITASSTFAESLKSRDEASVKFDFADDLRGIVLTPQQQLIVDNVDEAIRAIDQGDYKKVFMEKLVLGTAGSGKSLVIKTLLTKYGARALSAGYTGTVAHAVQGMTLHSLIGITPDKATHGAPSGPTTKKLEKRFEGKRILIIDEISLVGEKMHDLIISRLKLVRGASKTRAGQPLLIVYVGDFRQLPPVGERPLYESLDFKHVDVFCLPVSQRQKEGQFRDVLGRMGTGRMTTEDAKFIRESCSSLHQVDRYVQFLEEEVDTLCATNKQVGEINRRCLLQLLTRNDAINKPAERVAKARRETESKDEEEFTNLCLNARVMFETNISVAKGITNGTGGVVKHMLFGKGHVPQKNLPDVVLVRLLCENKIGWLRHVRRTCTVLRDQKYDVLDGLVPVVPTDLGRTKNSKASIPLRLRWGYTIHKSQGMTLDKAIIFLSPQFFNTQLVWVAFSRVRTVEGIVLISCQDDGMLRDKINATYKSNVDEVYKNVFERKNLASESKMTAKKI